MNEQEVVTLMESSKSKSEWNVNADAVKAACGGYPRFWYTAIIVSGVADRTMEKFGVDTKIRYDFL